MTSPLPPAPVGREAEIKADARAELYDELYVWMGRIGIEGPAATARLAVDAIEAVRDALRARKWSEIEAAATVSTRAGGEAKDSCPHCDPEHGSPMRCAWHVRVADERDGDGQPVYLRVQPSAGQHVANEDAVWLRQLIADWRPPVEAAPVPPDVLESLIEAIEVVTEETRARTGVWHAGFGEGIRASIDVLRTHLGEQLRAAAAWYAAEAETVNGDLHAALTSLRSTMAHNSRDWSTDRADAWLYGVVCGWDDVLDDVAAEHGWDPASVARLRAMHAAVEAVTEGTARPSTRLPARYGQPTPDQPFVVLAPPAEGPAPASTMAEYCEVLAVDPRSYADLAAEEPTPAGDSACPQARPGARGGS